MIGGYQLNAVQINGAVQSAYEAFSLGPIVTTGVPRRVHATAAEGHLTTNYGAHYGVNAFAAEPLGPTTQLGVPATPVSTSHTVSGRLLVRYGTHYGYALFAHGAGGQAAQAAGLRSTQYGVPSAATHTIHEAGGLSATQYGAAKANQSGRTVEAAPTTNYGGPLAASAHRALSLKSAKTGIPSANVGHMAGSLHSTRHGRPSARPANALVASGVQLTRYGVPVAEDQLGAHKVSSTSLTQYGTPSAVNRHRAYGLAPTTRFGRPTLRRNPTC